MTQISQMKTQKQVFCKFLHSFCKMCSVWWELSGKKNKTELNKKFYIKAVEYSSDHVLHPTNLYIAYNFQKTSDYCKKLELISLFCASFCCILYSTVINNTQLWHTLLEGTFCGLGESIKIDKLSKYFWFKSKLIHWFILSWCFSQNISSKAGC